MKTSGMQSGPRTNDTCIQAYHTLRTTFVVVWLKLTLILHLDKSC